MQQISFGIAQFLERTFDWFLTPFGWLPNIAFILIFVVGFFYWLLLQGRYNRMAREKNTLA
jgi:hypothetical protein